MESVEPSDKPVCINDKKHDWQSVHTGSLIDCQAMRRISSALGWAPEHGFLCALSNRVDCIGSCAAVAASHVQLWRCQAAVA